MNQVRNMLLVLWLALAATADARTINWGGGFGDTNVQSDGVSLTATFKFELGTFGSTFIPDATNVADWEANWLVFDTAIYSQPLGYFTSSVEAAVDGGNILQVISDSPSADPSDPLNAYFIGEQAYIWVYNVDTPGPASEWALITDNDGGGGNDWTLPDPGDQAADPLDWRVSNATVAIFGGLNDTSGPGERTGGPPAFDLQTHTFVPEPSSALLVVCGAGFLFLRRRRFLLTDR